MSLIDDLKESIIESEVIDLKLDNDNTRILDDEQANYFLRRLEELTNEKNELIETCNTEIEKFTDRVNAFKEGRLTTFNNTEKYIKNLLKCYAEGKLEGTNKKSLKLPFGTLQFRKSASKYDYNDDILLKYVKDNEIKDCLSIKESVNKSEIKKIGVVKDGKLYIENIEIPGVTVTEGTINFDVKLT